MLSLQLTQHWSRKRGLFEVWLLFYFILFDTKQSLFRICNGSAATGRPWIRAILIWALFLNELSKSLNDTEEKRRWKQKIPCQSQIRILECQSESVRCVLVTYWILMLMVSRSYPAIAKALKSWSAAESKSAPIWPYPLTRTSTA